MPESSLFYFHLTLQRGVQIKLAESLHYIVYQNETIPNFKRVNSKNIYMRMKRRNKEKHEISCKSRSVAESENSLSLLASNAILH